MENARTMNLVCFCLLSIHTERQRDRKQERKKGTNNIIETIDIAYCKKQKNGKQIENGTGIL